MMNLPDKSIPDTFTVNIVITCQKCSDGDMLSAIRGPGSECWLILITVLYLNIFVFRLEFSIVLFLRVEGENRFQEGSVKGKN
jgi:hypothetical protein